MVKMDVDIKIPKELFFRIRNHFYRIDPCDLTDADRRIKDDIETKYKAIRRHDNYTKMIEARKRQALSNKADA